MDRRGGVLSFAERLDDQVGMSGVGCRGLNKTGEATVEELWFWHVWLRDDTATPDFRVSRKTWVLPVASDDAWKKINVYPSRS